MLKKLFICAVLLMLVMPMCFAADLNAPAQKQITIRSEIQRGFELVCNASVSQYNLTDTDIAISNLLKKAQTNNTDTNAFLLGAYYSACYQIELAQEFKGNTENQLEAGKVAFNFYYKQFRNKQRILEITDQQIAEAVGINYEIVQNDLINWDTKVNGEAASK